MVAQYPQHLHIPGLNSLLLLRESLRKCIDLEHLRKLTFSEKDLKARFVLGRSDLSLGITLRLVLGRLDLS